MCTSRPVRLRFSGQRFALYMVWVLGYSAYYPLQFIYSTIFATMEFCWLVVTFLWLTSCVCQQTYKKPHFSVYLFRHRRIRVVGLEPTRYHYLGIFLLHYVTIAILLRCCSLDYVFTISDRHKELVSSSRYLRMITNPTLPFRIWLR